ncbi:hypothetical protein UFOVP312_36 [uncultured Caudovirales phage]|uniref:Uncharacterized protein n=1 Tax=uncultured Caudovirales phage TaxID=2100421 RepID=A0A6J5LR09_9CAUD|nr:hypothetical protein UFOVP312_36 [uncultured Caudovirales phage]
MTRRRFVQMREPPYELIEVTEDYQPAVRTDSGALWGDRSYDGMRAPDGTDISTRTKHRDYMKAAGVTTMDDFKDSWAKAKESRERYYTEGGSFKRADIERAIHQLQNR